MGNFNSAVITKKGQALMAKVVAGTTKLNFTRIAVSDSELSNDLASLTGIGTIRQSQAVSYVERQNNSYVKVGTSFVNTSLASGYYVRNIGLYATDPQEGEILYSISVADESEKTAEWMPPFNGVGSSSLLVDLTTAIGNASNVTVTVDPSAVATVTQLNAVIGEVNTLKSFVGYDDADIYGVEVDFSNKRVVRIAGNENLTAGADFDNLKPWMRKRCNLADNGTVNAYRGDSSYKEDGSNGMVMVEQPIFYTKVVPIKTKPATSGKGIEIVKARYYISPTPKVGFKAPEAFKDEKGILQDKIYLSAFEGSVYDTSASAYLKNDEQVADFASDKLCSIAGAKPASGLTQNLTRANVRKLCNNRGTGWRLHDILALSVTQWLILIEYATMNSQKAIGRGVCDYTDDGATNMSLATGATSVLGNGSGIDPNKDNGKGSVSYRGEENLWGNIWTWLDGINILAKGVNDAYIRKVGQAMADDTITGYENFGTQLSHSNGYQSAVGYSEEYPELFLPTACAGADSSDTNGDYYWQNNSYGGFFIAILGGRWNSGSYCGAWYLIVNNASSYRYRVIGGRLLYVPQTKVA